MSDAFFEKPILNSPYYAPRFHWELDGEGQPTEKTVHARRSCSYVTPVPKPKKRKGKKKEDLPDLFEEKVEGISVDGQLYDTTGIINKVRSAVDSWRQISEVRTHLEASGKQTWPGIYQSLADREAPAFDHVIVDEGSTWGQSTFSAFFGVDTAFSLLLMARQIRIPYPGAVYHCRTRDDRRDDLLDRDAVS